jgi:iron complex outermembrane receptor protein
MHTPNSPLPSPARRPNGWFRSTCRSLVLFVASAAIATAQNAGAITGRVSNAATGAYLEAATVSVEGTNIQTSTARGGEFTLSLPPGKHTLLIGYTGLDTSRESVEVGAGATVTRDVALTAGIYKLDPFSVTGLREGNALAIQQQRLAENMKTVAASDTFGNPASNPGELLQRLPGVTIDVGAGEATGMYIRGLGTSFISLLMDGNNIAASVGTSAARDFNLAQLATNNIAAAEVVRAPLPDQQANAIAGYVNLVTRRAFDSPGRRIDLTVGTRFTDRGYNDTPAKDKPGLDLITLNFSDSFDVLGGQRNLGVAFNATQRDATFLTEEVGPVLLGALNAYVLPTATNGLTTPILRGWGGSDTFSNPIRTHNFGLNLDYKLSPDAYVYLKNTYNANGPHTRQAGHLRMHAQAGTLATDYAPGSTYDFVTALPLAGSTFRTNSGGVSKKFLSYGSSAGYQQKLFERTAQLDVDLSYSYAHTWYPAQVIVTSVVNNVGWSVDSRGREKWHPVFTQTSGPSIYDPASYTPLLYTHQEFDAWNERYGARADFKKNLDHSILRYVKLGARIDRDDRWQDLANRPYTYIGPSGIGPYVDTHYKQSGGHYGPIPYVAFPHFTVGAKDITENRAVWTQTAADAYNGAFAEKANDAEMEETISAGYLQLGGRLGKVRVTTGVRYERTDLKTSAYLRNAAASNNATSITTLPPAENAARAERQFNRGKVQTDGNYHNVFPGFHANYEILPALQFRGSYNKSITRPAVASLLPFNTVNTDTRSVVAGNPELKPFLADNYELAVQKYFEPVGMIEVSVFQKDIVNYTRAFASVIGTGPDNGFDGQYEGYTLSTSRNIGNAKIRGFEIRFEQQFTFLPGFWRGFGTFGNFSYTKAEGSFGGTFNKPTLENQRPKAANGGISYVGQGLQARLLGNWEDTFFRTVSVNGLSDVIADPRFIVDFKLQYRINKRYEFYLDVQNLTNTYVHTQLRNAGEFRGLKFYAQRMGTIYSTGVKMSF